jgi:hypothetical protein
LIVSTRLSATRKIKIGLILIAFLLAGCTSRHLVPLSDGGLINPELKSAIKTENGVTVTVQASAWRGRPSDLEDYATPFYVVIENNTNSTLTLGYEDLVLLDENRSQYNPLPPETVAEILQADYWRRYAFRPYFPLGFGYFHSFHHSLFLFNPFFYDPFYDYWDFPPYYYYPERFDDVFTKALLPGVVQPNARLEGFVYFKRVPIQVKHITLEIGYKIQGEPEPRRLSFPFAIEVSRLRLDAR